MKKKIMTATILIIARQLFTIPLQAAIGGKIIGTVQFVCYGAAVIIIILKGVKLMNAAPEAKADAKKEMISYTIGAVLLFAVGSIIKLVADIATKAF